MGALTDRISNQVRDYRDISDEKRHRLRQILTIGWLLVLGGIAAYLLRNQREDLENIWQNLKNSDPKWLCIAAIAELAGITSVAYTFKITLERLGHDISLPYLVNLHVERAGVNFAAPFGGAVTGYVFLDKMARKNVPPEDALLTLAIRTMSVWAATVIVLLITAILTGRILLIVGAALLLVAAVLGSFYGARQGQGDWKTILRLMRRLPEKLSNRGAAAIERLKFHNLTPFDLIGSIGTTLLTRTATISLIYVCCRALGENPPVSVIFMAYVVSFVAGRIVPFLYGMGLVEGSLSIALQRGGVPTDIAIGAALLFRFYDFFAPSVIGLGLYAWDERHHALGRQKRPRDAGNPDVGSS